MPSTTRASAASARSAIPQTPPRVQRAPICPPAPARTATIVAIPSSTTSIVCMKIEMRGYGSSDDEVDEEDYEAWMTSTLHFASRDAMARYFTYLFESGFGNGYENAIMLHIEENSSTEEFLEKIANMRSYARWDLNRNLNLFIYNDVLNN